MKLVSNHLPVLPHVAAPWRTLALVCSKCRGARKGPDAKALRKSLKKELGKPDDLRITEVDCLKLCPDDAVAVCIVGERREAELFLVSSEADAAALAERLRQR